MKAIEIVCEFCQASERVGEGIVMGIAGRTGQLHCKECGNQIEFDAHQGDLRVLSGGLLLEWEDGQSIDTASPDVSSVVALTAGDEGSRDSLTPHTFVQQSEPRLRPPAPSSRASLSPRTSHPRALLLGRLPGGESSATAFLLSSLGAATSGDAAPRERALAGNMDGRISPVSRAYPLPPSRRRALASLDPKSSLRQGEGRSVVPESHDPARRTSSEGGVFSGRAAFYELSGPQQAMSLTEQRNHDERIAPQPSVERTSVSPVSRSIVPSPRTPWGLMTAAISLGMVVGLAIGVVGRAQLAEARFAAVPPVEELDASPAAWSAPVEPELAEPALAEPGLAEPALAEQGESPVDAVVLDGDGWDVEPPHQPERSSTNNAFVGAAHLRGTTGTTGPARAAEAIAAAQATPSSEVPSVDEATAPIDAAIVAPAAASIDDAAVEPTNLPDGIALSRGTLSSILNDAAAQASVACREPTDSGGVAQVTVTFANSGKVTQALVSGRPFAGTATGSCIARHFRSLRVDPFSGERVTVKKTVAIH